MDCKRRSWRLAGNWRRKLEPRKSTATSSWSAINEKVRCMCSGGPSYECRKGDGSMDSLLASDSHIFFILRRAFVGTTTDVLNSLSRQNDLIFLSCLRPGRRQVWAIQKPKKKGLDHGDSSCPNNSIETRQPYST